MPFFKNHHIVFNTQWCTQGAGEIGWRNLEVTAIDILREFRWETFSIFLPLPALHAKHRETIEILLFIIPFFSLLTCVSCFNFLVLLYGNNQFCLFSTSGSTNEDLFASYIFYSFSYEGLTLY